MFEWSGKLPESDTMESVHQRAVNGTNIARQKATGLLVGPITCTHSRYVFQCWFSPIILHSLLFFLISSKIASRAKVLAKHQNYPLAVFHTDRTCSPSEVQKAYSVDSALSYGQRHNLPWHLYTINDAHLWQA